MKVDAANGVAAEKLVLLNALLGGLLVVKVYNDGSQGKLSYKVRGLSSYQGGIEGGWGNTRIKSQIKSGLIGQASVSNLQNLV